MTNFNLIIGMGQVGQALYEIFKKSDKTLQTLDKEKKEIQTPIDIMHICLPYSQSFETITIEYIKKFKPRLVIIHSTVKVGTTKAIQEFTNVFCVHSPVVGQHNNLIKGLKTFEKWIGGTSHSACYKAYKYFKQAGLNPKIKKSSEITEFAKLFSTFRYGLAIARAQEEARICDQIGLDFNEVITQFINMYNKGYEKLGMKKICQPNTFPGVISGHCVMENLDILLSQYPDFNLAKDIKRSNEKFID